MGKTYLQGEILTALDLNASLNELVNTTGSYVFTGVHTHNANVILNQNTSSNGVFTFNSNTFFYSNVTLSSQAILSSANNIIDKIGEMRAIPLVPSSGNIAGKTLDITDHGKCVVTTSTITVPADVFSPGQNVTIYNQTDGSISVLQGTNLTLYNGSTGSTGTRTLYKRAICSILFITGREAIITGSGIV
jgi:hypothetical protein